MTSLDCLVADPWFPFEGAITVKSLLPPVVPEPPRAAEGAVDCPTCARPETEFVWADRDWALQSVRDPRCPAWCCW